MRHCAKRGYEMNRRAGWIALPALAALAVALVLFPYGKSSAQEGESDTNASDPGNLPTPDVISNEKIQILDEGGLIARQAEISEGMLLMDRQLRQAQLIEQLLAVLGPDAKIEVSPGNFASFADTPAGLRERIALLELQLELSQKIQEVGELPPGISNEANATSLAVEQSAAVNGSGSEYPGLVLPDVVEIYGQIGALRAVLDYSGEKVVVRANDMLPGGGVVMSINRTSISIVGANGNLNEVSLDL